jgi:dolichol-phosphate mannosyltransferase
VKVAVVLPAYNEEGNLTPLVTSLAAVGARAPFDLRVIVVDDGSTDETERELAALQQSVGLLQVARHSTNQGLARALKTGIAAACRENCDAAVFMDSDLSHRVEDLPRLVAALADGADVVLGSRFIEGGSMEGVATWRAVISRLGNRFGRLVLGLPVRDLTTGYRAVRRTVLEAVELGEEGFTIQLEGVVKAYEAGFKIVEVPIVLETRRHGRSSMSYSVSLFHDYWRLLMACRRRLRQPVS